MKIIIGTTVVVLFSLTTLIILDFIKNTLIKNGVFNFPYLYFNLKYFKRMKYNERVRIQIRKNLGFYIARLTKEIEKIKDRKINSEKEYRACQELIAENKRVIRAIIIMLEELERLEPVIMKGR